MSDLADDAVGLKKWSGEDDRVIQDVDWKLEDRQDSTNRLEVTTSLSQAEGIQAEQELIFQNRRFIVDSVDRERAGDKALIIADEAQAELSGLIIQEFKMDHWTLQQGLNRALRDTRWSIGEIQPVRTGRSHFDDITVLDALKFLARHQGAQLHFDSLRRRVNITLNAGVTHEKVFTYGRQLTNIEKTERAPVTTRIYPSGADDMGIAEVNDGVEYVENFDYYKAQGFTHAQAVARYLKEEYWSDNRYEIAENLMRDAESRLEEEAWPQITFVLTAAVTHSVDAEGEPVTEVDDFGISELALMDQVHVWDQETDTRIKAEVSAITKSSDASVNEVTLSYLPESLGASTGGRYFGDSGRIDDGPGRWTSPVPPRPSMPILESVNDLGVGKVRWNGQDEHGDHETIPRRFGTLETIVASYDEDGSIPSPDGETAFSGTVITNRNGGISTVSFAAPGNFAVWFYLVGYDARTRGPYSEPLSVEVEALVDTEAIRQQLEEAQGRIDEAQRELEEAMEQVREIADEWSEVDFPKLQEELAESQRRLDDLRDVRLPALDEALENLQALSEDHDQRIEDAHEGAESARETAANLRDEVLPSMEQSIRSEIQSVESRLRDFEQEWDENWDPSAIQDIKDRQETLEGDLITGLEEADASIRRLAIRNTENLINDRAFDVPLNTDPSEWWANDAASWERRNITVTGAEVGSYLALVITAWDGSPSGIYYRSPDAVIPVEPGETYMLRFKRYRASAGAEVETSVNFQWVHGDGSTSWDGRYQLDGYASMETITHQATVPEGVVGMRPYWRLASQDQGGTTGRMGIVDPSLFKMNDGQLTVDGSILARHANFQSFGADQAFIDMLDTNLLRARLLEAETARITGDALVDGAVSMSKLSVLPDAQDFAPGPGGYEDLWTVGSSNDISSSSDDPSGYQLRVACQGGVTTQTRTIGPWLRAKGGDRIHYRMYVGRTGSPDGPLRIYFALDGSLQSWQPIWVENASGWVEGTYIVRSDVERSAAIAFATTSGTQGDYWVRHMEVRPQVKGVLIEDGAISANHIVAESVAGAVARFIDLEALNIDFETLAGEVASIIDITAEVIGAGSISTNQLVVGPKNMITDRHFATLNQNGSPLAWRPSATNLWYTTTDQTIDGYPLIRISDGDAQSSTNADLYYGGWNSVQAALPCEPGEEFRLRFYIHRYAGSSDSDDYRLYISWVDAGGNFLPSTFTQQGGSPTGARVWTFTAPEGAVRFRVRWSKFGAAGGARGFTIRSLTSMTDGNLIVDGSIGARHVVAEEVAGAVGSFLRLSALQITTGTLNADRINSASLFANRGFITNFNAQTISAIELITQRIITGDIIATGTIDVEHLNVTESMVGRFAQFLHIEAGMIDVNALRGMTLEGGLVSGGTVRSALIETTSQANRGGKLDSNALRAWDSNGNPRFELNFTSGDLTATGMIRTNFTGDRVEIRDDGAGGRIQFYRGSHRARLKMSESFDRLEMVYGAQDSPSDTRPYVGVEDSRAMVGFQQSRFIAEGTSQSDQGLRIEGSIYGNVDFEDYAQFLRGARIRFMDNLNRNTAVVGQSPGAGSSSMFQIWLERGSLNVVNGGIQIPEAYRTTSSTTGNVYISSSGWLSRATSASRYKLDQQELTVPDSLLDVPVIDWIDKAQTEFKAEMDAKPRPYTKDEQTQYDTINLRRIPGVVAETVEEYGGEQFVIYGPDGQVEEVMYDRLALAQIQVLKRMLEAQDIRIKELEAAL